MHSSTVLQVLIRYAGIETVLRALRATIVRHLTGGVSSGPCLGSGLFRPQAIRSKLLGTLRSQQDSLHCV